MIKHVNLKRWISALILICCLVSYDVVVPCSAAEKENKEVLSEIELKLQERVSVNFIDTSIDEVIRTLAEQANIDVIKGPEVTGNVTAKLTDVPLKEAMDNILAAHGYGYIASDNMIRIAPAEQIAERAEKLVSKIYRITYADVRDVEKALKNFISSIGSISSNPGTSNIIVTDIETKIKAMDTFIEEIDRKTPQILVEARIYDITCKDRFDLGVEWQAGRNTTYDATHGLTGVGYNPSGDLNPFMTALFNGTISKTENTSAGIRLGWLNSYMDIDMLIRAEKENINAKLLANPRILVLDNEKAEIKIVSKIPYQQLNQGGGVNVAFGTTDFKDVGVTLIVVPHLTRDGLVRLQIAPKFSVQTGEVTFQSIQDNISYPQPVIDEREAATTLLVKDGQTIVLGGLRKKDVTQQINKIPLLGDLPLLGSIFRFEGEDTVVSELVVFITPRILEDPALSETEKQQYEITNFEGPVPVMTNAEKEGCGK